MIVLCGGFIITCLIAGYISGQSRLTQRLRHEIVVRAEAENELRESEQRFRHVARLSTMGELVTGIAHEVNQPLSAIANYSSAANNWLVDNDRYELGEPVEEWLSQIRLQAIRCGDIIRRLRGFVMKDSESWESVDLNNVVRDSIALVSSQYRHRETLIECDLHEQGPRVQASEIQLQQVLVNLLINACDATRELDLARIHVTVKRVDNEARVTVQDNGAGIEAADTESLFDPFFSTKSKGMGMGLAISRSIVEAHRGKLWLASEPGSGATFHVQLPISSEPEVDAEAIQK